MDGSNYLRGATAKEAKEAHPASLITAQLDELGATNERFNAIVDNLERTLAPVLEPEHPQPAQATASGVGAAESLAHRARTPLEERLGHSVATTEAIRRRLASILDRVRL
jgi:hypothetical protein